MKSFNEFCESQNTDIISKDIQFWQKLSGLSNTMPQDLSNILNVPTSTISKWKSKIDNTIKQIEEIRSQKKKNEMIKTGAYEK